MRFQAQRGTEDVLPSQAQNWRWVESEFQAIAKLYGYGEVRTPAFEDIELFTRTSGETSEVVTKQMYDFVDKGGRHIALKPEGTAPAIRALIEHNLCPQGTVCRLSYITEFFRYERPQKGRLRQAHQAGLEIVGSASAAADAEIVEVTVRFFERLGLTDLKVLLNSIGRSACREAYRASLVTHASEYLAGLEEEARERVLKNPLRLLDSKDPKAAEVIASAPSILDCLEPESLVRFTRVQSLLKDAGINFEVAPQIVRGLDYYTETVFEVQSEKLGAQSSLCGGGRYDELVKDIGGPATPAVGVGIGIERLLMVLESSDLLRAAEVPDVFVAYAGQEYETDALAIAREVRQAGVSTVMDLDGKSLKSQLRQADRLGAVSVVLIGEDEAKSDTVTVRTLASGEQTVVPRRELVETLLKGRNI